VAMFFALIGVWPQAAVLRAPGGEPSLMRSFVLGAGLALIFALAAMFIAYVISALRKWRWASMSGYPAWVVLDVFCDTQRDAGSLINGTGDFVFVAGPTRRMLLGMRRMRFMTHAIATLLALAGMTHWIIAWLMTGAREPAQGVAVAWAVPLLLLFTMHFVLGVPEWRVRRHERSRIAETGNNDKGPPVKGELVKMWMASAERARKSLSGPKPPG